MKSKILNTIKKYRLIKKNDNILLGVSGGPDSMALFYVLKDIKKQIGFNLYVAHINHGVRGGAADKDQRHVENICSKYNIPIFSKKVNMDEYGKKHGLSSEEAGRIIRYKFFRKILRQIGGGKISVAHNRNDQAETVIMRFIRGSGVDGLMGMDYINDDIIRPMLNITRAEIESYCEDNNIPTRLDKTNLETIYGRNKVRLELIPYIRENFNNGIIDTLWRMSHIMRDDGEFLNEYSKNSYNEVLYNESHNKILLYNRKILKLHKSIKSRIIRYAISKIKGNTKNIEQKHMEAILTLSSNNTTGKSLDISGDLIVKLSYDFLIIQKKSIKEDISFNYRVDINNNNYIEELDAIIKGEIKDINNISLNTNDRFIKYFDYDKIKDGIIIRTREPGDRFIPLGMNGTKKVKDFFIDKKISKEQRGQIPIVVSGGKIIWIVGYRISEEFKLTNNTKKVLVLKYIKL